MTTTLPAPTATDNKDLQLVNGSMELIQDVPKLLSGNQAAVAKAKLTVKEFIDRVGENGNKLDEELDNEAQALIVRLKEGGKKMEERRKPFTQIVQSITKMFTGLEAEMKELEAPLQVYRNDYAKWLHQEAEKRRIEAERKAAVENAKADFKAEVSKAIGICLSNHLFTKKNNWTNSFNGITLETFDDKATKLKALPTAFNRNKLNEILQYNVSKPSILTETDWNTSRTDAHTSFDFNSWIASHDAEMAELKQSLVDKLPSLKSELEAAAEAERERIAAEETARKAEAERQAAIAKANAAEKERLEKEAAIAREADAKRMAEMKAEQERIAAEKAAREKEEAERLAAQKAEQERKASEAAELSAAAAKAQTLFDAAIEATPDAQAPETRTGFDIKVTHHAGWAEIFQLYYTNEGVKLGIDELGKKSLNQMKSWCESHAKKTGEKISSKYLVYESSIKAVNRKS